MRPRWAKAHARLGAACEAQGQLAKAADAYRAAAALSPASAEFAAATRRLEARLPRLEDITDDAAAMAAAAEQEREREREREREHEQDDDDDDIGEPLDAPQSFEPRCATYRQQ